MYETNVAPVMILSKVIDLDYDHLIFTTSASHPLMDFLHTCVYIEMLTRNIITCTMLVFGIN